MFLAASLVLVPSTEHKYSVNICGMSEWEGRSELNSIACTHPVSRMYSCFPYNWLSPHDTQNSSLCLVLILAVLSVRKTLSSSP